VTLSVLRNKLPVHDVRLYNEAETHLKFKMTKIKCQSILFACCFISKWSI